MTVARAAIALAIAGLALTTGEDVRADSSGGVVIDISKPQRSKYPIAIPTAVAGDSGVAKEIAEVASFDLKIAGWFKVLDPKSFLADLKSEGTGIDPEKWKDVGAYGVIKYSVSGGSKPKISFKLYEIEKGTRPVLQATYTASSRKDVRYQVHRWCNAVVKYYTGEEGFFGSRIAFTSKSGKKKGKGTSRIMTMDFDGHGAGSITRNNSINILPAWSRSGGQIAFTSYMRNNPDLYVVGAGGGRPKQLSKYRGMNTGASWSPDGGKIALTLSKDGNPEIYIVNASSGKIIKRLTNNRAIDTSPAWSPGGNEIAFVSDREGGPQIFVMSAGGGGAKRVSSTGGNNTTPSWSPQPGKRILAYTTRGEDGNFDIITVDLNTEAKVRITQGEGTNEEPSWAPNGRAIAFARLGGGGGAGVYIASADGKGDAIRVYSGAATSIDWGPAPKQ